MSFTDLGAGNMGQTYLGENCFKNNRIPGFYQTGKLPGTYICV
jgi:hypothetical protein